MPSNKFNFNFEVNSMHFPFLDIAMFWSLISFAYSLLRDAYAELGPGADSAEVEPQPARDWSRVVHSHRGLRRSRYGPRGEGRRVTFTVSCMSIHYRKRRSARK